MSTIIPTPVVKVSKVIYGLGAAAVGAVGGFLFGKALEVLTSTGTPDVTLPPIFALGGAAVLFFGGYTEAE